MKAFFAFPIFILMNIAAVIAQSIVIQAPANGAIVNPASTITVKIARPVCRNPVASSAYLKFVSEMPGLIGNYH